MRMKNSSALFAQAIKIRNTPTPVLQIFVLNYTQFSGRYKLFIRMSAHNVEHTLESQLANLNISKLKFCFI